MAQKKIQSATDQRPFIMVYQDFLESDLLDTSYQKLVYIYLKKYADTKNQCFPSIRTLSKLTKISVNKVKQTLAELEEKGLIAKQHRTRPDGGKSSNLYTLFDYANIWNAGSSEEIEEVKQAELVNLREVSTEELERELARRKKEKELESDSPTKVKSEPSTNNNQLFVVNNTSNSTESQVEERWSMAEIKEQYDYKYLLERNPYDKDTIDGYMDLLYEMLNEKSEYITISGNKIPVNIVWSRLEKLYYEHIQYCMDQFGKQTNRIHNTKEYKKKLLYEAYTQMNDDINNQVQHDLYGGGNEPPQE